MHNIIIMIVFFVTMTITANINIISCSKFNIVVYVCVVCVVCVVWVCVVCSEGSVGVFVLLTLVSSHDNNESI